MQEALISVPDAIAVQFHALRDRPPESGREARRAAGDALGGAALAAAEARGALDEVLQDYVVEIRNGIEAKMSRLLENDVTLDQFLATVAVELSGRDRDEMLRNIDHYIRHYRARLPHETERQDRIYIRMADIFDAFDDDPRHVVRVFKLLGASPITGILYEDVRDSRFTFESNALVRLMRRYLPRPRKIPAHPHSGNGMEDAATIEAVVAGANDVWSGFTPQAAQEVGTQSGNDQRTDDHGVLSLRRS